MGSLEIFLTRYGLWALFFAAAVEGDVSLLLAGLLIHIGVWSAPQALVVGWAGALAGDGVYFWLGHGASRRWLKTAHGKRVLSRMERFARRYGIWSLFLSRYIYGARAATMVFWGMRRLPAGRFLLLDAFNCIVWTLLFAGLGYLFSDSLERLIGELRVVESGLLIGLASFLVLLGLRYCWVNATQVPKNTNDSNHG